MHSRSTTCSRGKAQTRREEGWAAQTDAPNVMNKVCDSIQLSQACSHPGFVEEMRFVAMKLHTKDQAPKEGQKESTEKPLKQVPDAACSCAPAACFPAAQSQHCDLTPPHCACLQWQPSRRGYLRFLTESKQVYDKLEGIVAEAPFPECEPQPAPSAHSYSGS